MKRQGLRKSQNNQLLSAVFKIFTKVIANRIRTTLDFDQPNDQAGLGKTYSTIDHIHNIKQVPERCAECAQPLYTAFIDYEKAFGSVKPLLSCRRYRIRV